MNHKGIRSKKDEHDFAQNATKNQGLSNLVGLPKHHQWLFVKLLQRYRKLTNGLIRDDVRVDTRQTARL